MANVELHNSGVPRRSSILPMLSTGWGIVYISTGQRDWPVSYTTAHFDPRAPDHPPPNHLLMTPPQPSLSQQNQKGRLPLCTSISRSPSSFSQAPGGQVLFRGSGIHWPRETKFLTPQSPQSVCSSTVQPSICALRLRASLFSWVSLLSFPTLSIATWSSWWANHLLRHFPLLETKCLPWVTLPFILFWEK